MPTMHNHTTALTHSVCKEYIPVTKHGSKPQPVYHSSLGGFIFEVCLHFGKQNCLQLKSKDGLKEILYGPVLIFCFNVAKVKICSYINSSFSVFQMGDKSEHRQEVLSWPKGAHTQMK